MNGLFYVQLSPGTKLALYADDIVLYKPLSYSEGLSDFQQDIQAISNWIMENDLSINHSKTKALVISRLRNPPRSSFSINGFKIDVVDSSVLTSVGLTILKQLGFIYHHFYQAPPEVINNLYKTLVLPHVDYCSSVWDPQEKKYILALEKVQSFAHKIMFKDWSTSYLCHLFSHLYLKGVHFRS